MTNIRGGQKRPCSSVESTGSCPVDDHNMDRVEEVMGPTTNIVSGETNKREKLLLGLEVGESSRTKYKAGTFDCSECGGEFDTQNDLLSHRHGEMTYPDCDVCGAKFETRRDFLSHQKVHSPLVLAQPNNDGQGQTQIQTQTQTQTQTRPLPPALPYIPPSALAAARPNTGALRRTIMPPGRPAIGGSNIPRPPISDIVGPSNGWPSTMPRPSMEALIRNANGDARREVVIRNANGGRNIPRPPMGGVTRHGNNGGYNVPRMPTVGLTMLENRGYTVPRPPPIMGPSMAPSGLPREWVWFRDVTDRFANGGPIFRAPPVTPTMHTTRRTTVDTDIPDIPDIPDNNVDVELELKLRIN